MAGTVSSPIKWTPNDNPIRKAISTNQRSPRGLSMSSSQRNPNQNMAEVISIAMAYTSASTALNQKLSENV